MDMRFLVLSPWLLCHELFLPSIQRVLQSRFVTPIRILMQWSELKYVKQGVYVHLTTIKRPRLALSGIPYMARAIHFHFAMNLNFHVFYHRNTQFTARITSIGRKSLRLDTLPLKLSVTVFQANHIRMHHVLHEALKLDTTEWARTLLFLVHDQGNFATSVLADEDRYQLHHRFGQSQQSRD